RSARPAPHRGWRLRSDDALAGGSKVRSNAMKSAQFPLKHLLRSGLVSLLFVLGTLLPAAAHADDNCFERAGTYQGVNPLILRAIAWFESKGNPNAFHRNADGSVDVGQTQIN